MMSEIKSTTALQKKLRSVLLRQRLVMFAAGMLVTIAVVLMTWMLLSLAANVMVLSVWLKVSLLVSAGLVALFFFVRFALARLFDGNTDAVAVALEQKNPRLKGRLVAAVQFARRGRFEGFSSDLIEATRIQALAKAGQIDFGDVVSFRAVRKTGRLFAVAAVLATVILLLAPGFFDYAFEVYSNPTTRIAPPIAYGVTPVPASTEWVKYRDIRIGGAIIGQRLPEKAVIFHRLAGGSWQETKIDIRGLQKAAIESGDSCFFGTTLRQINRSFDFYVKAGEITTATQKIDVVDRPRVTGINLSVFYPEYTELPPLIVDENNGSFAAVVGSRATLKIATNLPIEKAELIFDDSSRTPLTVEGKTGQVALNVDRSRAYRIELLDHLGEKNPDPIEYYITAIPDEYPSIDVLRPGFDVNLNDEMILPLLVRIFDDYGFSSLVMKFTVFSHGRPSEEHVAVLHYSDNINTQGDVEFNWDMDRLNLFPGDYVMYFFEVADNDVISGPKVTKTRQYIARLPSLDEIIAEVEQESMRRIISTEDLVRAGKETARRIKEAARKLEAESKTSRTADWQQQKELESVVQRNEEMLKQVEKAAADMQKSLEKLQDNSLMSREIMEKLAEIQKLFEDVATPEMREAQQKLMEALRNMNQKELEKAMKDFQMSQDEMLERLERTLALLKRMQAMQKMEAMIRKAEEITKQQAKMNEQAEASDKESLPNLSEAEDENREALEELKKEVSELQELMKQAGMEEEAEAQKFTEALEKTDAEQNMQQMSGAMQKQQKQQAGSQGKKAHSKLLQMLDQMQQAQMAMSGGLSKEMELAMRRAIDHANNLSQDQEDLLREAQAIDPRSVVIRDLAASQQDLAEACTGLQKSVTDMANKNPFVAGDLKNLVDKAISNMEMATQACDSKTGSRACAYQREAMFYLNRAAIRLMESLDQQQQCKNGGNCNKGMAKLESMCRKQGQLNKQTQGQCNNPGSCSEGSRPRPGEEGQGQPGQGQQGQGLRRLAGEQGAIRKSMEELEREFGGSRQILGRLSDISREMKEVEEALASGEVGPETLDRQLRIYSRMLEAARSLQRKDFTEKRQAASASEQPIYLPQGLSENFLDETIDLEDRLRRFLGDDYPPQYEEQIKAYFKALLNTETEMRTQPEVTP
ncbi:MAG: hypothetical protein DRP45_00270 [Candidatus Zixiibacteriota bacterium]|nr:MAG: hypothetical protein DRP45_00270 [candidate division Zixibacteria bacterium]